MNRWMTLIFAVACFATTPAFAQSWGSGASKPSPKELIPKMHSQEAYTERYGFAVDLDGGGHVGVDFTISNLGIGDGHGAIHVRVNMPGEKNYSYSKKLSSKEWSSSTSGFALKFDNTTVSSSNGDTFVLKHTGAKPFELTFTNKIPMWRPGNGRVEVSNGYYAFNLIAPRADVTGTVAGKAVTGSRAGYADHVATNVAPFDFAKRFMRFRHYNGDVFVMWREIELAENGKSLTWVVVGYKDQIVFSDANATLKFGSLQKDAKAGYQVPRVLQLDAKSGKDSVRIVMRGSTMKSKDLLESYGTAAKLVASAVSKPYQYNLNGKYTLQMNIGGAGATIEGNNHYTIDYLNP